MAPPALTPDSGEAPACEWYKPASGKARSLRSKMIISMAIVFGLGCVSTVSALYSLSRVADKLKLIELSYELNQKVLETRRYEKNFLLYHNRAELSSALDYIDQVRAQVSQLAVDTDILSSHEISKYRKGLEDYADVLQQLNSSPESPPFALKKKVRYLGQQFTEYILERDAQARLDAEVDAMKYRRLSLLSLATTMLLTGIFAIFLIRWTAHPLEYLRRAATRIMHGELTAIPMAPAVRSSLEGVELVNSLNLMLDSLNEKQEALIQSAKLATIGQVTAGLAHEVNNPLNNISLTAEVLLEEFPEDDQSENKEMISEILAQTERAREVVQNLLVFIRMAKTTQPMDMDIGQVVEDSVGLLKNQIRLSQIKVETDLGNFPKGQLHTKGFPSQVEQVLINIMLNAIQAMSPGGCMKVKIAISDDQRFARIHIEDNGPGIEAEERKHIFDPFYTTKSEGTGLGLSVSYSIIEKHGGSISVDSEPGEGTTFVVELPLEPTVAGEVKG